jgi:hypothetical protein
MKAIRNYIWFGSFALALLVLCSGAQLASGQSVKGEFTLPFNAQWGIVTLSAGHYSFTLDWMEQGRVRVRSRDGKTEAFVLAQALDKRASEGSYLTVVRENGVNTITELMLAEEGVVIRYPQRHRKLSRAAKEREMAQLIPVAVRKS